MYRLLLVGIVAIAALLLSQSPQLAPFLQAAWLGATPTTTPPEAAHLSATELRAKSEALIIDVREPAAYAKGHLPGARNIPIAQLAERAHELGRDRLIALYCT